jgi:hypothetical protein
VSFQLISENEQRREMKYNELKEKQNRACTYTDWKISTGIVTPAQVLKNFQSIIAGAPDLPTGFIGEPDFFFFFSKADSGC